MKSLNSGDITEICKMGGNFHWIQVLGDKMAAHKNFGNCYHYTQYVSSKVGKRHFVSFDDFVNILETFCNIYDLIIFVMLLI